MHFLITALGSYGDVHPMVGLGSALARRGHRVSLVANPYFENEVRDAGLNHLPFGTCQEYLQLVHHPDIWHPVRAPFFVWNYACGPVLERLYDLLVDQTVPGQTVIVSHGLDLAGRIVGEKHGVPVAGVHFAPAVFLSKYQAPRLPRVLWYKSVPSWIKGAQYWCADQFVFDRLVGRPVNKLRKEVGLEPISHVLTRWWHKTDAIVGLFPPWFAKPQPDWPVGVKLTGFPLWDSSDQQELPGEVSRFLEAGEAPLVWTPGSANATTPQFFTTAVEVCQLLGRRGIVLTKFADQLPDRLPEKVRHFDFVPLSYVLPRAAAFIHHGGIGSCAQGLSAGVPQLIRPMAFDQFDNSIRLQRLGVGCEVSVGRFRASRVAKVLDRILTSDRAKKQCRHWAVKCDGLVSLRNACETLETLAC